jgi:hypothetical protein
MCDPRRRIMRNPARLAQWIVAVHVLACLLLLSVAPGTELQPDMAARAAWVDAHRLRWTLNWLCWMVGSMSIGVLFVLWSRALKEPRKGIVACLICITGSGFDLIGEWTYIRTTIDTFARDAALYTFVSPGIANGLYCVGGLILSVLAWRDGLLRGAVGLLGFATWIVGLALTIAALVHLPITMAITGAATMGLFIIWATLLSLRLRPVRP